MTLDVLEQLEFSENFVWISPIWEATTGKRMKIATELYRSECTFQHRCKNVLEKIKNFKKRKNVKNKVK